MNKAQEKHRTLQIQIQVCYVSHVKDVDGAE